MSNWAAICWRVGGADGGADDVTALLVSEFGAGEEPATLDARSVDCRA
jgi:hypothetical protein